MRRHFQGYTIDRADALLPFGYSSIGGLPPGLICDFTVDQGELAFALGEASGAGAPCGGGPTASLRARPL